jgi:hypothetical protein
VDVAAIGVVIWLVVLVDALFGPDIVSSSTGSFARIPSAIVVACFVWLATWMVASHGFGHCGDDADLPASCEAALPLPSGLQVTRAIASA